MKSMNKIVSAFTVIGLALAVSISPASAKDKDKGGPPGLQKKGGVPPGLQKKGGVPPGQAKKQGRPAVEEEDSDAPVKVKARERSQPTSRPSDAGNVPESREPSTKPVESPAPASAPETSAPKKVTTPEAKTPEPVVSNPTTKTSQPASNVRKETQQRRDRLDQNLAAINAQAADPNARKTVLKKISSRNDISVAKLEAQLKAHPNLGPADLYAAHEIARESKKPVERIIAQHEGGKSWGELANEHRAGLQDLVEHSGELKTGLERAGKKSARK